MRQSPKASASPSPVPGRSGRVLGYALTIGALVAGGIVALSFYFSSSSIRELLTENRELERAIQNLSAEEQIGYAKVHSQGANEAGELQTVVRFVQTAAGNPREIVSEQLFTVNGDIAHFDALIVKFTDAFVKDGSERALYLWRRVYGEDTPPRDGERIEEPGTAPERYYEISRVLQVEERKIFWDAIWDLANDPARLSEFGVKAVYGNAIYTRLVPGNVYLFKIGATGQIYPEVVREY